MTPVGIESRVTEEPIRLEVDVVRGERRDRLLTVPVDLDEAMADYADVDQFEVEGGGGRVVFVQLFLEMGEDIFRREILAFAIDVEKNLVIWEGGGRYENSFGYCEAVDIPEPRVEGMTLIIDRWTGTFRHDDMEPLGDPCPPVPERRAEEARVDL